MKFPHVRFTPESDIWSIGSNFDERWGTAMTLNSYEPWRTYTKIYACISAGP
jgi:hypothetical protein